MLAKRLVTCLAAAFITLTACTTAPNQGPIAMNATVKNIVLVHGAWADGSGWEGVHTRLSERGYNVSIVQNPLSSLADDVAAVDRVLERQTGPVLLVGHSYGGAVITEAGDAKNVAGLVYVAAFAPDAGESVSTLLAGGQEPPLQPSTDGFLFFNPEIFPQAFAQDLSPARAAFLAASQIPTAGQAFATPVSVASWRTKPSFWVLSTDDRIIPPEAQRMMAGRANAKVTEIKASHAVYISQADAVAGVIDSAARALQ